MTATLPQPETAPHLDKPGAGVPLHEILYLKLYLGPFVAGRSDWEKNWKTFDDVNARVLSRIDGLSSAQLEKHILVPPMPALEDSSRYWSVAMTLEHLVIVHDKIKKGILALSSGVVPSNKADTASVKPKGGKDGLQQLAEFNAFNASLRAAIDSVRDTALASKLKYAHPWFGPFTALQWQWLFGAHTHIHYRQIKEIVKGLR